MVGILVGAALVIGALYLYKRYAAAKVAAVEAKIAAAKADLLK